VVGEAAAEDGRPHAGRNPDDDRDEKGRERELDRRGERVEKVVNDRAARPDAPTEVAVNEPGHVGEVLLGKRPIEVVLRSERFDLLVGRVVAERGRDRVGRDDV